MSEQKALQRIQECAETRETTLDLSGLELIALPEAIGQLVWLENLNCDNNSITDLSPLSGLSALERLNCDNNSITDLSPLSGLSDLQRLDCNNNTITDLSPLSGLSALKYLDCDSNTITDLSPLSGLSTLEQLDCRSNTITDLSPLSGLSALQRLDCDNNTITDLSPLSGLSALESLFCSSNTITDLSPLSGLSALETLDCDNNTITDLSPLSGLSALKRLDCDNNTITDLSPLSGLSALESLYCSSNTITDLSPLSGLSDLQSLGCRSNTITDLSPLSGLSALKRLDCRSNTITDLSPLSGLSALQTLDCDNNTITDLSPLSGLSALQSLGCRSNTITDLSPLSGLSALKRLDCDNNTITDLSPLSGLSALQSLFCSSNPITTPPAEIVEQGIMAMRDYWNRGDTLPLHEIKVMFLGSGGAGKTSIRQRLSGETLDPEQQSTQGIDLREWLTNYQGQQLRLNLWDFAGQEINYSLHELFFTERTIYVIVLNGREEDRPEKWLERVRLLAGKESSILLVRNKIDDPSFRPNPVFDFLTLANKYQISGDLIDVSAREGHGMELLQQVLLETAAKHPQANDPYPRDYIRVKEGVEDHTKRGRNHISYEQFFELCQRENISDQRESANLLRVLANLGTVSFFDDLDLRQIQILNPAWLSGGIYKLLLHAEDTGGLVRVSDFPRVLQPDAKEREQGMEWAPHQYSWLVNMLKKHEQGLSVSAEDLLIPRGLRTDIYPRFDNEDCLRCDYRYHILPDSVFPRLIVSLFRYAESYGRNHLLLRRTTNKYGTQTALLEQNDLKKIVQIRVAGDHHRSELLDIIRHALELIHGEHGENNVQETIPLDDEGQVFRTRKFIINYLNKKGKDYYEGDLDQEFDLAELIGHYIHPSDTAQPTDSSNHIHFHSKVAGDVHIGDRHIHRIEPEQSHLLAAFRLTLNEFLAQTRHQQNAERLEMIELANRVDAMLATNATDKDPKKFRSILQAAGDYLNKFSSLTDKAESITTNAAKCAGYITKILAVF